MLVRHITSIKISETNVQFSGSSQYEIPSPLTSTPNLLNVAVSRAKETVIFIGNYEDWKEHNYVPTIMAELEDYGKGRLKLSEVLNEPERNN